MDIPVCPACREQMTRVQVNEVSNHQGGPPRPIYDWYCSNRCPADTARYNAAVAAYEAEQRDGS